MLCAIGQVQNVMERVVGIGELVKEQLHGVVRDWLNSTCN